VSLIDRDRAWCEKVLAAGEVGWLALGGPRPYVIPVNYHWQGGRVLIHTALTGRKLEHLAADERVCFGVGSALAPLEPHGRGGCYLPWRSVIIEGRARLIRETAEKLPLLQAFLDAYQPGDEHGPLTEGEVANTLLIIIEPEAISGREETGAEEGEY